MDSVHLRREDCDLARAHRDSMLSKFYAQYSSVALQTAFDSPLYDQCPASFCSWYVSTRLDCAPPFVHFAQKDAKADSETQKQHINLSGSQIHKLSLSKDNFCCRIDDYSLVDIDTKNPFLVYTVNSVRGDQIASVMHRYGDFRKLSSSCSSKSTKLPASAIFGKKRIDNEFAEKRMKELDIYINKLVETESKQMPLEFGSFLLPHAVNGFEDYVFNQTFRRVTLCEPFLFAERTEALSKWIVSTLPEATKTNVKEMIKKDKDSRYYYSMFSLLTPQIELENSKVFPELSAQIEKFQNGKTFKEIEAIVEIQQKKVAELFSDSLSSCMHKLKKHFPNIVKTVMDRFAEVTESLYKQKQNLMHDITKFIYEQPDKELNESAFREHFIKYNNVIKVMIADRFKDSVGEKASNVEYIAAVEHLLSFVPLFAEIFCIVNSFPIPFDVLICADKLRRLILKRKQDKEKKQSHEHENEQKKKHDHDHDHDHEHDHEHGHDHEHDHDHEHEHEHEHEHNKKSNAERKALKNLSSTIVFQFSLSELDFLSASRMLLKKIHNSIEKSQFKQSIVLASEAFLKFLRKTIVLRKHTTRVFVDEFLTNCFSFPKATKHAFALAYYNAMSLYQSNFSSIISNTFASMISGALYGVLQNSVETDEIIAEVAQIAESPFTPIYLIQKTITSSCEKTILNESKTFASLFDDLAFSSKKSEKLLKAVKGPLVQSERERKQKKHRSICAECVNCDECKAIDQCDLCNESKKC